MYQHILDKGAIRQKPSLDTAPGGRKSSGRSGSKKRQEPPRADPAAGGCSWPGCSGSGEHRAPKSRDELDQYRWFCLEHIRVYNKSWNFYAGMNEEEIEREIRRDTTWRRPSWPLGARRLLDAVDGIEAWVRDVGLDGDAAARRARNAERPAAPRPAPVTEALDVLGLDYPVDAAEVKRCYKELVKRHHPDTNGGSRDSEERFKRIAAAYRVVMEFLTA